MTKEAILLVAAMVLFNGCQPVPITGRQQLHLIPQSQMIALGIQSYDQVKAQTKVITGTPQAEMVTLVGRNIQQAVTEFLNMKNQSERIQGFKWEYNLFLDSSVNAWAMPGGKIGVYTGILPYTQNDTGLAVVLGHEIAHIIAGHGDERMSQALLVNLGGLGLQAALAEKPQFTQQMALAAFGLGAQVGILLPYSRLQESEADHLGLIFMAMAGYDPHAAIPFWKRMEAAQKGSIPAFLSDHPSDEKRIKKIEELIPEAMKYYKPRA